MRRIGRLFSTNVVRSASHEKGRLRRTVILRPPREVAASDEEVEDEADDAPADVVERGRRGQVSSATKDDRPVDVLEE